MSSKFDKNYTVFFNHPKDWVDWSHEFRTKARALDLWDYINPETLNPWPVKPTPLNLASYPKKLVRVETRASSSTALSQMQPHSLGSVDEADPRNSPTSVAEMTAEGRAAYQLDWSAYVFQTKEYKDHITNREKLTSWILSSTLTTLKKTCCKEGETLDNWYLAFREAGLAYERNRIPDARAKYKASIKPLSKLPRSLDTWLTEWETAVAEGQQLNIPDTAEARFWAEDLAIALRAVLPIWATNFITLNKQEIEASTLSYREVATDLRRTWQILQQPKLSIAKGAFTSYGSVSGSEHPEIAESENEEEPRRKSYRKQGKGKRKRAETGATGTATSGGGSCRACLGPHALNNCFYALEEKAPADWKPNLGIRRLVEDRIKADNSLAEQIKRFRKGKDSGADNS
jgi:hypothetical protein